MLEINQSCIFSVDDRHYWWHFHFEAYNGNDTARSPILRVLIIDNTILTIISNKLVLFNSRFSRAYSITHDFWHQKLYDSLAPCQMQISSQLSCPLFNWRISFNKYEEEREEGYLPFPSSRTNRFVFRILKRYD